MRCHTRAVDASDPVTSPPGGRAALGWACAVGLAGALGLVGVALVNWAAAALGLFFVRAFLPDTAARLDSGRSVVLPAVAAILSCLTTAVVGGWRLSPSDTLLPPALTGALWGLAGTAVGYAVLWAGFGFNPLG